MIVVSGCPRSGTSLMMRIMERVFGGDRILKGKEEVEPTTDPELTEMQEYLWRKQDGPKRKEHREKQRARAKDMNPNGYYEMAFAVSGISYHPHPRIPLPMSFELADMLQEAMTAKEAGKPKICKSVSHGLARSNPMYISKVVFMARDPMAVAKSQERLGRDNPMNPEDAPVRDGQKVLIREVDMFNHVTIQAAQWIQKNQQIPVHIVNYDQLLDNPASVLADLQAFLGEGDFTEAEQMIDKNLRRSKPEEVKGEKGAFAKALWAELKAGRWDKIIEAEDVRIEELKANPPKPERWFCPRLGQQIAVNVCELCWNHQATMENLKRNAEKSRIRWEEEPCPYECGIQEGEGKSIAESIAGNHWLASGE